MYHQLASFLTNYFFSWYQKRAEMASPTDQATVTVWVAKKGTSEDDAIEIEACPDDSLS